MDFFARNFGHGQVATQPVDDQSLTNPVVTQPTDDEGFTKPVNKRRRGRKQQIAIDTTVEEDETIPSPPPQSPVTIQTPAGPSESAFPLLPQVEHRTGVEMVAFNPAEAESRQATFFDDIVKQNVSMLQEQMEIMIDEAVTKVVSRQDAWNNAFEKRVPPLLDAMIFKRETMVFI